MNRDEAEKIYNSGKEPAVEKLLKYDDETKSLKRKIARLEKGFKEFFQASLVGLFSK